MKHFEYGSLRPTMNPQYIRSPHTRRYFVGKPPIFCRRIVARHTLADFSSWDRRLYLSAQCPAYTGHSSFCCCCCCCCCCYFPRAFNLASHWLTRKGVPINYRSLPHTSWRDPTRRFWIWHARYFFTTKNWVQSTSVTTTHRPNFRREQKIGGFPIKSLQVPLN